MITMMLDIVGIAAIFAAGAWFYVLAQGAHKKRYTRGVLNSAWYAAGEIMSLGIFTSAASGLIWALYDFIMGVNL